MLKLEAKGHIYNIPAIELLGHFQQIYLFFIQWIYLWF